MQNIIRINEHSKTPKYRQIVDSILSGLEGGDLKVGDKLPSVNKLLVKFDISRDTVVKAYDRLKVLEVIESVPGKGYYIRQNTFHRQARVFLLFNKLSTHKKMVYDAFRKRLGEEASIDFFIYDNNYRLFKKLILEHIDAPYTHFVIIAHFLDGGMDAAEVINKIPKDKLVLLDKLIAGVTGDFAAVYQDFGQDIYQSLKQARDQLRKYERLKIIFPPYTYHAREILSGFSAFCTEYAFNFSVVNSIKAEAIQIGDAFINLMEDDLVTLIKRVKSKNLQIGKEVGIISYNETPLKEILLDGITVISTDFEYLGATAARLILEQKKEHIANPFRIIFRNSL